MANPMKQIEIGQDYLAEVTYVVGINGKTPTNSTVVKLSCAIYLGDDIPLSVKVYWHSKIYGPFPKKGDTIQVTVVNKFSRIEFKPSSKVEKEKTMSMSKDRIRFFLGDRYFKDSQSRGDMVGVLMKAFKITYEKALTLVNECGVWIICRPSQFARFMVYRNEAGIQNGFMDLKVELFMPEPERDAYSLLAIAAGVDREAAKRVALALAYDAGAIKNQFKVYYEGQSELDVSKNST